MRLSNTMMINESLLPTGKKAFTLAEVLITLSILGVVAALTIPSLVNRQSDLAAQVKLKKAISNYEDVIGIYMAENEVQNAANMMGAACVNAGDYFKIVDQDGCKFTTSDGAAWSFDAATGNATVVDTATGNPRYGVALWNANNRVNAEGTADGVSNTPDDLYTTLYGSALIDGRGISTANYFMSGGSGNAAAGHYYCVGGASLSGNAITCNASSGT